MYQDFAKIYDELMEEFPYEAYENILLDMCPPKGEILEIGCGTGKMTDFFFHQGASVTALDPSLEMLSFAKRRVPQVRFLQGHIEDVHLGSFQQVYACVDILNYYLDKEELGEFLAAVRAHCRGTFFFDLRHPQSMKKDLVGRSYYYESSLGDLVWNNEEIQENVLWQELIFYWKEGQRYRKGFEEMKQRIWSAEEIEGLLQAAGFKLLKKREEEERYYYVFSCLTVESSG